MTQATEASTLKSLVQNSAEGGHQTNMKPNRLAEALLSGSLAALPTKAEIEDAKRKWSNFAYNADLNGDSRVTYDELLQVYAWSRDLSPDQISQAEKQVLRENFAKWDFD